MIPVIVRFCAQTDRLIKNDINNAQTYYAKSIEMSSGNTVNFEDSISKDKDILLNFGVSDIKISILRDIIINNAASKKHTY